MSAAQEGSRTLPSRRTAADRTRIALVLALVALVAAVVGAVGPAAKVRTTYSWPPTVLPAGKPTRFWYSPLLLIRHAPESIAAELPCSRPQPLPAAGRPLTVLTTARNPEVAGGLSVTQVGTRLVFTVGDQTLERASLGEVAGRACSYRLRIEDDAWTVEGGANGASSGGTLDAMPVVTGLFSALDLRSRSAPLIKVTTTIHATRVTKRQELAWAIAVLGIVASLVLVTLKRRPRRFLPGRDAFRAASKQAHPADAVVAIVLLGWLVLSPVFWDDGWVVARERAFSASRGFSTYFDAFGVNLPLDYWVEWLQHWITQSSTAVPLMRLPALVCLAVVWVLCRWSFVQIAGTRSSAGDVAIWALTAAFLAEAFAWGMTLRPEPVTALLATSVMACALLFRERASAGPVAIAAVLVPLALTAHHTGVVSLAPVIAVAPQLVRWGRAARATFLTIITASFALLVVLAFVGSDITQRVADARTSKESGITQSWRDELQRYTILSDFPFSTPLRRGSVALIALALLAYIVRRRRTHRPLLDLPAITLAISLALLLFTTSKLPWHFGALIGITALAVAAETLRLREEASLLRGWRGRWLVVIGAAILVAAWSWGPRTSWNPVDLRTIAWTPALESVLPYALLAVLLPLIVLFGATFADAIRGEALGTSRSAGRTASWTAPLLAAPLIVYTVGVLVADFAKTPSWTLTRQNLGSLVGRKGCGLADVVLVPRTGTATPLRPLPPVGPVSVRSPLPVPARGVTPVLLSAGAGETAASPWFGLPRTRSVGLFVAGLADQSGQLMIEWGRDGRGRIVPIAAGDVSAAGDDIETDPWSFLVNSELPERESKASSFRLVLAGNDPLKTSAVAVAPVTYGNEVLTHRLEAGSTLVHPNLLLYFPCAEQPRLDEGAVDPPDHIIWFDHPFQPHPYEQTSTFRGLRDLYDVRQQPTSDSAAPPERVVVFEVHDTIPGAQIAPSDRTTEIS
jgi:hypothetical protein